MIEKVILVALFTFIIHASETLSYSVRLAGIRVGKLAVALSLTGIIVLISRTSNMVQAPLTGKIIDDAKQSLNNNLINQFGGIPKRLMLLNCVVTAVYTVGVLAALLASTITLNYSTTASQSSGLINGIATILLTILIDPQVALITDKVMRGEKEISTLNKVFGLLMVSRLAGTIVAQFILVPAAYWIKWAVSVL